MFPPVFPTLAANAAVKSALGTGPTRIFPAGEAPQGTALPFMVYQEISGVPENFMGEPPDLDQTTIQFDIYAANLTDARAVTVAVRAVLETVAHVVSFRGASREAETADYHVSFDVDWYSSR